jgi:hypothetical protein
MFVMSVYCIAFSRIFSFWPRLDINIKNLYVEDKVQPHTEVSLRWPDRHSIDSYLIDLYKFQPSLTKL